MSEVSDLSRQELAALSKVVELWDEICSVLAKVEAHPRDGLVLHIDSEIHPFYLGWVGYNENGDITFQPSIKEPEDLS
jgi:hypothetical protein